METTRNFCTCLRCGWKWTSKTMLAPKKCPRCQTPNWNQEPRPFDESAPTPGEKKKSGRPSLYGFEKVEVGETVKMLWPDAANNTAYDPAARSRMARALTAYERYSGRKFRREATPTILKVTRVN